MTIELVPGDGDAAVAVAAALSQTGVVAEPTAEEYASPWRAAALREGVSREPSARPTRHGGPPGSES
jgi:hypothetical protein